MQTSWTAMIVAAELLLASAAATAAPAASPSPSPSSSPVPSHAASPATSPTSSPAAIASVTIHCPGVGDGTFARGQSEIRPPGAGPYTQPTYAPLPSSGGPGTVALIRGALDEGYSRWLDLGANAQPQACDLDVARTPDAPHERFAVLGAVPILIVRFSERANVVLLLEMRYAEIERLGF